MHNQVERAKKVLSANTQSHFGVFGFVASSRYFPPRRLLNEFLSLGHDPCDQAEPARRWRPFALPPGAYARVKGWWLSSHPASVENSLGKSHWDEWAVEIITQ